MQAIPPVFPFTLNILRQHDQLYGSALRHKQNVPVDPLFDAFDASLRGTFFYNIRDIVGSLQAVLQPSIAMAESLSVAAEKLVATA